MRYSISSTRCKPRKAGGERGSKAEQSAALLFYANGCRRSSCSSLSASITSRSLGAIVGSPIVSSMVFAKTSSSSMAMAVHAWGGALYREGNLVPGDVMLAQKIALETDERGALAVAKQFLVPPLLPHVVAAAT